MTRPAQPDQAGFYTVRETARYLRLCEKQVRRLISRRELPAFRFGTALRIRTEDIDVFVASRRLKSIG
jgi:excisionase family DNA binding protein